MLVQINASFEKQNFPIIISNNSLFNLSLYLDNFNDIENLYNFHEYFNGDDGTGVGASHQTGWTAVVRRMLLHRWGFSGD
jgi:hypothetical protein